MSSSQVRGQSASTHDQTEHNQGRFLRPALAHPLRAEPPRRLHYRHRVDAAGGLRRPLHLLVGGDAAVELLPRARPLSGARARRGRQRAAQEPSRGGDGEGYGPHPHGPGPDGGRGRASRQRERHDHAWGAGVRQGRRGRGRGRG